MLLIENYERLTREEKVGRHQWINRVVTEASKYEWNYFVTLTYEQKHQKQSYNDVCDDLNHYINAVAGIVIPMTPYNYLLGVSQHYSKAYIGEVTPYHITGVIYAPSLLANDIENQWRQKKIKNSNAARMTLGRVDVSKYNPNRAGVAYAMSQAIGGIYRTNIPSLKHTALLDEYTYTTTGASK